MIMNLENRLDQFGMAASTVCAFHCILVALAPAAFSAIGLGILAGHGAEWGLSISASAFALIAAAVGFRTHGSIGVVLILLAGALLLIGSRFLEEWSGHGLGTAVGIFGSISLITGHLLNLRQSRCCGNC